MRREKVAGMLQRPKGAWLNSKSWPPLVRKAIFSLSRSWIGTCQYPLLRSRVENQRAPSKASRRSSMRGRGCASLMVAALSCRKSTQKRRLPSFFLTITTGEAKGCWLDLGHFFSPDSWVLAMIGLAEGRSFGFNGVLQQWGAAKIVLSLVDDIAEFLEEVLQLLLLDGRQVFWDRWLAKRLGGGWGRCRVSEGDNLQGAYILASAQAERLWTVVMDRNPYFGAVGERGDSGHKRRQSLLWAEVDILVGPGIMTADQAGGFSRDVGGLEQ